MSRELKNVEPAPWASRVISEQKDGLKATYWVKSFGASLNDLRFYRLPAVVERARRAVPDTDIVGYLICALERPPRMTGLLFCDRRHLLPEGLPIHTPPISDRYWEEGSVPVIYICGNHELYKGHIDRTLVKMRDAAAPHVHILENQSFVWQQTRFLGTTAWTDFSSTGDVVAASNMAWQWMNDFRVIRADANFRRLRPDDLVTRNKVARAWLTQELEKPFPGRTIVVTHHAPTPAVIGDKHDGHLSAAYANHWPELIEKADLWVFGHTHRAVDVELLGCRVISNPRGYPGEDTGFHSGFEVQM